MKNIYQLAKLHRRAMKRSSGSLHALTKEPTKNKPAKPWKGNAGVNIPFHRARIAVCAQVITALKKEFLKRRIGLPGVRDARKGSVLRREALHNYVIASQAYAPGIQ